MLWLCFSFSYKYFGNKNELQYDDTIAVFDGDDDEDVPLASLKKVGFIRINEEKSVGKIFSALDN